jgi:hypothetical protein
MIHVPTYPAFQDPENTTEYVTMTNTLSVRVCVLWSWQDYARSARIRLVLIFLPATSRVADAC